MELFNTQLVWDYLYEETTILNRNDPGRKRYCSGTRCGC